MINKCTLIFYIQLTQGAMKDNREKERNTDTLQRQRVLNVQKYQDMKQCLV